MSDMINPAEIEMVNAGINAENVLTWPITTNITALDISLLGINPTFDKEDTWPEVTPPGWDGPITHTLHLFLDVGGWVGSGIIQYYRGLTNSGGPIWLGRQIAKNWVYDGRWGRMQDHQPVTGEGIGFMVAAGNQRGQQDVSVKERSNIVVLAMPNGPFSYSFHDDDLNPPIPPEENPPSDRQLNRIEVNVKEILRILQPYKKD